jgi:putative tryptophan/tyrosine transport system substrate-binding protein
MRRREFITLMGAAAAWPLAARAQSILPTIGVLNSRAPGESSRLLEAFRQGLKERGFVEGLNVRIEYRFAHNQNGRLPELAADLAQRQVTVIVSMAGTPGALAAKAATKAIPIVFQAGVDPVAAGLVASLNRPEGNLTGVSQLLSSTFAKQIELLHELIPKADIIALLINPTNQLHSKPLLRDLEAGASSLGLQLQIVRASTPGDFDKAYTTLLELRAGGLVIGPDIFFLAQRDQLVALAARHSVPAIYPWREGATAGGLMSYGSSQTETYRQLGIYTGRILKGEKPADLPVQQSTKVEFIINLKTAKALGLTVPNTLIGRADEVIE